MLSLAVWLLQIAKAYEAGGAACLSVLTDAKYFQGSFEYLAQIRAAGVGTPLLCKEFIVEAYQLFKARAAGADAVLLIAAVLPNADLAYLIKAAAKCKLQVLLEVHTIAGGGHCFAPQVLPREYIHEAPHLQHTFKICCLLCSLNSTSLLCGVVCMHRIGEHMYQSPCLLQSSATILNGHAGLCCSS